ncbi:MAG: hypothetical protein A2041_03450 [Bacteroidetes bacterium GWA2_31_9b]|nr:MAG: hypothetical protein A2041_03450 [Bacteroidetes bacterium GWA2_31_9b]
MSFINKLKGKAKKLKNEIIAISLAFNDKRTPLFTKIIIGLTISYALSPIDLIPDFIPIIGYLDDLIILPLMITLSIKLIPSEVMIDCRMRSQNESKLNKKIGLISAIFIILIWIGLLGLIIFKIF